MTRNEWDDIANNVIALVIILLALKAAFWVAVFLIAVNGWKAVWETTSTAIGVCLLILPPIFLLCLLVSWLENRNWRDSPLSGAWWRRKR